MKKLFVTLLASALLAPVFLHAQGPALNSGNLPKPGKKITYLPADTSDVLPGPSGENVTWDFTQLSDLPLDKPLVIEYMDPVPTPYSSDFPEATMAVETPGGNPQIPG